MGIFRDVLITTDYDRTLTAPDSSIPQRNLEAIRYFIENGGAFTVNTGRTIPSFQRMMDKVPVNAPFLLYNGSAAYDYASKEFLFAHEIKLNWVEVRQKILDRFPSLWFEFQGEKAHYLFRKNAMWEGFCENNHFAWSYAELGDDLGPFSSSIPKARSFPTKSAPATLAATPTSCSASSRPASSSTSTAMRSAPPSGSPAARP